MVRQRQARLQPGPGLLAGLAKHPAADRQDEAAFLRDRNELRRRDQARAWDASSGSSASAPVIAPGLQIDLGLVVQREFLALQGAPQALLDDCRSTARTFMAGLKNW